jgi:hypothetical protein
MYIIPSFFPFLRMIIEHLGSYECNIAATADDLEEVFSAYGMSMRLWSER